MLLNDGKCQGYSFYRCELLMKTNKPPLLGLKITPHIQLKVKTYKTIQINMFSLQNRVIWPKLLKNNDLNTSSKCYWSLLKTLLNRKKILYIPPLFYSDKYIVDFQDESEIFSSFFGDQCSTIWSGRVLPSELPLQTDSTLSSSHFTKGGILRITKNLDTNKAQGYDKVSICMLKICRN